MHPLPVVCATNLAALCTMPDYAPLLLKACWQQMCIVIETLFKATVQCCECSFYIWNSLQACSPFWSCPARCELHPAAALLLPMSPAGPPCCWPLLPSFLVGPSARWTVPPSQPCEHRVAVEGVVMPWCWPAHCMALPEPANQALLGHEHGKAQLPPSPDLAFRLRGSCQRCLRCLQLLLLLPHVLIHLGIVRCIATQHAATCRHKGSMHWRLTGRCLTLVQSQCCLDHAVLPVHRLAHPHSQHVLSVTMYSTDVP